MRNFGLILLVLGILGFFYSGTQKARYDPIPAEADDVSEQLRYPAGRWEMARYGCGLAAGFGLLLALFPKGR